MAHTPLSLDTPPDVERRQIDAWRQMSGAQKAAAVTGLTRAVFDLAYAGVRRRHPGESPRSHFLRVAVIVLGKELAGRAYPDSIGVMSR